MIIESLDAVIELVSGAENGQVEFKETTGQLERGMETLCAFLNMSGGTVLFGVTDKGKIIGQDVSDKTKRDIADAINRLEPMAAVQVSYVPLLDSEKKIIVFHADESRHDRPFCYKGRSYLPEPEYITDADRVKLVFRYMTEVRPSIDQVPTKYRLSTDHVVALVKVLVDKELSVKDMMDRMGLNHRPTFRTNYLHPALNEGYIVSLYPDQPSHPRQKYSLTDKGKNLLKSESNN